MKYFETIFLEPAEEFIGKLDKRTIKKIFYNIEIAEYSNDPRLFKKLNENIWEFRTMSMGLQIRLLAFWDKTNNKKTLVIATHGFIKKIDKVPSKEIARAVNARKEYFLNK